jgi:CubicO group peptidase (beta-lactamase class C family)
MSGDGAIEGVVAPGWEGVRDALADNLRARGEVGAGVAVYHRGRLVVDLAAGLADPSTGRRWTRDTPGVVFSATKGLVAACFLVLEDRGLVDLDAPIASVWPEFGRDGKEATTIRQLLNHRAGLSAIDRPLSLTDVRDDPGKVHDALVAQRPSWRPGADQGYAACSYGLYTQEVFRRVAGRTLGAFFADEIARPLGLATVIGRPADLPEPPARLVPAGVRTVLTRQLPTALLRDTAEGRVFRRVLTGRRSLTGRAFLNPALGPDRFEVLNDPAIQAIELPWMNALTTARGLARLYAALAGDGSIDGVRLVRAERLGPLHDRQTWSERDRVLHKPMGWSQGFVKDEPHLFSRDPRAFGHPGAGGALGWADPAAGLSIGYVPSAMDWRIRSPRALAICHAVHAAAAALNSPPRGPMDRG